MLAQLAQIERWLAGKMAQLEGLTAGESVESAETALREHGQWRVFREGFMISNSPFAGHFAETLAQQLGDRLNQLDGADRELEGMGNESEAGRVRERVSECRQQCEELQGRSEAKLQELGAAKRLALFLRECAELMTWMNAKLQLAMDDAFLDATALRLKLKKHLAFDAELKASQHRVERLRQKGEQIVEEEGQFDEEGRVRAQLEELMGGWEELVRMSGEKGRRLGHAYQSHQLGRRMAELESWLDSVEGQIGSEDHGSDIGSAQTLLEQFGTLKEEIRAKRGVVEELVEGTAELGEEMLTQRAEGLQARWEALGEPCLIRGENLVKFLLYLTSKKFIFNLKKSDIKMKI